MRAGRHGRGRNSIQFGYVADQARSLWLRADWPGQHPRTWPSVALLLREVRGFSAPEPVPAHSLMLGHYKIFY